MTARFYYHSGGDVVRKTDPNKAMSIDDVVAMTELHRDEVKAARKACDAAAFLRASALHEQIFTATFEARRWLRAASYSNTDWRAHG